MNQHNLSKAIDCRVSYNGAVAGTGDTLNGTAIDTLGWDGILFLSTVGTLTATAVTTFKLQGGAASDGSDGADIQGTAQTWTAATDSNKLIGSELFHPKQRYIRPVITRATANAVINPIIAVLYRGEITPVTVDTTVVRTFETFNSPPLGTA